MIKYTFKKKKQLTDLHKDFSTATWLERPKENGNLAGVQENMKGTSEVTKCKHWDKSSVVLHIMLGLSWLEPQETPRPSISFRQKEAEGQRGWVLADFLNGVKYLGSK